MSGQPEGIKIALPGDVSPEEAERLAKSGQGMDLRRVAAQREAAEIEADIEDTVNSEVLPYKDDAPICEDLVSLRMVGRRTEHLALVDPQSAVVAVPAWARGRCIGPACARWKVVSGNPICGKALQDLAAAQDLGLTDAGSTQREFRRWAYPKDEGDDRDEEGDDAAGA